LLKRETASRPTRGFPPTKIEAQNQGAEALQNTSSERYELIPSLAVFVFDVATQMSLRREKTRCKFEKSEKNLSDFSDFRPRLSQVIDY
jgi:hypothetical protein